MKNTKRKKQLTIEFQEQYISFDKAAERNPGIVTLLNAKGMVMKPSFFSLMNDEGGVYVRINRKKFYLRGWDE